MNHKQRSGEDGRTASFCPPSSGPSGKPTDRIVEAIRAVPPGRVSCYRDVALRAGLSAGGARQVVWVLHTLSRPLELPWHRIIRADGRIALEGDRGGDLQRALLRAEGLEPDSSGRYRCFW